MPLALRAGENMVCQGLAAGRQPHAPVPAHRKRFVRRRGVSRDQQQGAPVRRRQPPSTEVCHQFLDRCTIGTGSGPHAEHPLGPFAPIPTAAS